MDVKTVRWFLGVHLVGRDLCSCFVFYSLMILIHYSKKIIFYQEFNETIAASKANATESMKNIPLIMRLIKEANETAQAADQKVSSAEGDSKVSFNTATSASNVTQTAKNVRFFLI